MSTSRVAPLRRTIDAKTATCVVVANMIGAGIFTTTGFQAAALGDPIYIYALWLVGGALALCGAVCYAELGSAMPHAGGEYVYLREAYGPSLGFMSAIVSLIAGFSAPIAAALMSLMTYLSHYLPWLGVEPIMFNLSANQLAGICVLWGLVALHSRQTTVGLGVTNMMTLFKVTAIVLIIVAGAAVGAGQVEHLYRPAPSAPQGSALFEAMASSLVFVMFCYSGWNSASYLAGELHNPGSVLPRALLGGTALVVILYLGLNLVYFYGAGVDGLAGKVEVALVASERLFGSAGAALVTAALSISLLAAASVMTAVGPRVYYAAGRDTTLLRKLAEVDVDTGVPVTALVFQALITTCFIVLGTVEQIQQYAGFTLSLFATLSVSTLFVLRSRAPRRSVPFRVPGYPFTPLLFIAVSLWMVLWAFRARPVESFLGLATVGLSGLLPLLLAGRSAPTRPAA